MALKNIGLRRRTNLNLRLYQALQNQHWDAHVSRHFEDLESGVNDIPMDWTPVEETLEDVIVMIGMIGNMRITIILPHFD